MNSWSTNSSIGLPTDQQIFLSFARILTHVPGRTHGHPGEPQLGDGQRLDGGPDGAF